MLKLDIRAITNSRSLLINSLIKNLDYSSYLEIGVGMGLNYKSINCQYKTNVDPRPSTKPKHVMTSDQFFETNNMSFDLIFIDGLHTEQQVHKDILNALDCINKGGTIVVHDCNPEEEHLQMVPAVSPLWTGDVWKCFVKFIKNWNYPSYVVDIDYGCGIIECDSVGLQSGTFDEDMTWEHFDQHRDELLDLHSFDQFHSRLQLRKATRKNV